MNILYTEQNAWGAKIYSKTDEGFVLLKEIFPALHSGESKEYTEFLNSKSPAEIFSVRQNRDFSFWQQIQNSHNPLDWVQHSRQGDILWHIFDCRLERLLAALKHPKIEGRNFQEGVTLVFEQDYAFFAVLAYKNEIFGAFEHDLQKLDSGLLKKNLEEFRFGWLPDEEVRRQGGKGCILKNIPAEAEGFRPTFIFCEHKEYFSELGRILPAENTKEQVCSILAKTETI